MQNSAITLRRAGTFSACMVPFSVRIDGTKSGRIWNGSTKTYTVQPGPHSVQLRYLWGKSESRMVDVQPGANVGVECTANPNLFMSMFAMYFAPSRLFVWR